MPASDDNGLPMPWMVEQWLLRIDDGIQVLITLEIPTGRPTASRQRRAIVRSIQLMEWDNPSGYPLAFQLPAGWDSG